ncbi:hypothetical protein B0H63DRAFT_515066 [Podospora didyma]|uniref:Uncharacterized protein n=1 Tax=Podospora didyma TaxID=330526 RepID=A0AAE0N2M4_9PEZI|nr:hypothetical protein B0H63DRAFT_515066 [Podospora didyma]
MAYDNFYFRNESAQHGSAKRLTTPPSPVLKLSPSALSEAQGIEVTWPEPRVIEVAYVKEPVYNDGLSGLGDEGGEETEEPAPDDDFLVSYDGAIECVGLRLTCGAARWLQTDSGSRVIEDQSLEKCLDPIALQVCHEPQAHAIGQFKPMQHPKLDSWAFYFNPRSDILWLNTDVTDNPNTLNELQAYYGKQLN